MHRNLSEFSVNFIRLKLYWHMCCKNRPHQVHQAKHVSTWGQLNFTLQLPIFSMSFPNFYSLFNKEDYKINQIELAEFETSFTYGARMMSITNEIFPSSVLVLYVPLYTMVESFFLSLCPRNSHLFKSDDDDNEEVNGERSCPILSFCPSINARKTGRSMLSGTSCKKGQFDGRYQTIFGFKLPTNPYSSLFRRALYASRDLLFLKQKIF